MRILITGGNGFVGGRLGAYFSHLGHEVLFAIRCKTSSSTLPPFSRASVIQWDDDSSLRKNCHEIDVVIHAAGVNSKQCEIDPIGALAFNGLATGRLVNAAYSMGVKKFCYLSTAHVYGSPLRGEITEEADLTNLHPYATSHAVGENAVLQANQDRKIQGIVMRLSNSFGVPISKNVNCWMLLVNDLCRQAIEKKRLTINSHGLQQRDFIGLTNVCDITNQLISKNNDVTSICSGVFNVGSSKTLSVRKIAELIQGRCEHLFNYRPEIEFSKSNGNYLTEGFTYKAKRLGSIGISFSHNQNLADIDRLLNYCKNNFKET